ncbi:MAG: translation initiation factor IF-3 [Chlamydiae bacterium]|nr:translation initiation factor IF-3 [Chlamydiota bacterium]
MFNRVFNGAIGITDCNTCRGEVHLESRESRINEQIRVSQVRLIDENGEQLGIVPTYEARRQAQDKGLDLVEIAPQAQPPVCKIMNYGKFRYSKEKQEKKNRKAQIKVKELKLRPGIADNDIMIKVSHAKEFLSEGAKQTKGDDRAKNEN